MWWKIQNVSRERESPMASSPIFDVVPFEAVLRGRLGLDPAVQPHRPVVAQHECEVDAQCRGWRCHEPAEGAVVPLPLLLLAPLLVRPLAQVGHRIQQRNSSNRRDMQLR